LGFSCKSVSKANSSTAGKKLTLLQLRDKTASTAVTFWAGIDWLAKMQPVVAILENVDALLDGGSDEEIQT